MANEKVTQESSYSDKLTPVILAGGIGMLVFGAWEMFKPKPTPGKFTISEPSASPDPVVEGGALTITVTIAMDGGSGFDGQILCQIKNSGILWTSGHLVQQLTTSAKMQPGDTITATFKTTATGGAGEKDVGIIVLQGNTQLKSSTFDSVYSVEVQSVNLASKVGVIYNPDNASLVAGVPVTARVTIKNTGTVAMSPSFRLDLKKSGLFSTHNEGTFTTMPSVAPGAEGEVTLQSIPIPSNWSSGTNFVAIVILNGVSGDWDTSPTLTVGSTKGTTAPQIHAVFSSGSVDYDFEGFTPGAQVTVTLVGTDIASQYITADSSGQGNGVIPITVSLFGVLVLQATDTSGVTASVDVTVTSSLSTTVSFFAEVSDYQAVFPGADLWWAYYHDPVSGFISDDQWHPITGKIEFDNVNNGGYLAIFLQDSSTGKGSAQITTKPVGITTNGETVTFDAVTGIGTS